jgi:hypothetical protein
MTDEKRRDRRHGTELPALIVRGKRNVETTVKNVCFRGMFLGTDDPPSLRQLIRVEMQLPPGNGIFSSHATVVRVADGTDGRPKGVGIELFANDRSLMAMWDDFVRYAEVNASSASVDIGPLSIGEDRRRHRRFEAALEMRLRTNRSIHTAFSRNMSQGGILVLGSDLTDIQAGEQVILNVIHPESHASFRLPGVVRRQNDLGERGQELGVEFETMDSARAESLLDFILTALEVIEERKKAAT